MSKIKIYPYNMGSRSARALADVLRDKGHKTFLIDENNSKVRTGDIVINWGNSTEPQWSMRPSYMLNNPALVEQAINKLRTFNLLSDFGIPVPHYTESFSEAFAWLDVGHTIVARSTLTGHSGAGITLHSMASDSDLPDVPLYVEYKKKRNEYRIHVAFGEIIDVQEKRRSTEVTDRTEFQARVRSHENGWVFCRENIEIHEEIAFAIARDAIRVLGLSFGAVDMIYNAREDKYYVLEVNTAVGLEGTTLETYAEAFHNFATNL